MCVRCITLYSRFAVKAGVKKSRKTWSPNIKNPVHQNNMHEATALPTRRPRPPR